MEDNTWVFLYFADVVLQDFFAAFKIWWKYTYLNVKPTRP